MSDTTDRPSLEVILFLFPALYEAFGRLRRAPNPWGLVNGSIIEMQINPGEGLMEQMEDFIAAAYPHTGEVEPPRPSHITLVGPLGSRELDDVVTLRKNYEHVRWYLTPEVFANRANYASALAGVVVENIE
jgi:hypothetical protein